MKSSFRNKGFTLIETLIVVMILTILFSIVGINVFKVRKETRQSELDAKAEIIYVAASNRLVELRSGGNYDVYQKGIENNKINSLALPEELEGKDLYYVSNEENLGVKDVVEAILPKESIISTIYDEHYVIEYDPSSASVFAVFYSEDSLSDYNPMDYYNYRSKEFRLKKGAKVGYFDGGVTDINVIYNLSPTIEIKNTEILVATLKCPMVNGQMVEFKDLIIKDESGNSVNLGNIRPTLKGRIYEYVLKLDDLNAGHRFKDLYPSLNAGEDITISFTAVSSDNLVEAQSVSSKTNSLFAEKNNNEVTVLYGRHLQNLDADSGVISSINKAVQKRDINFIDDINDDEDYYSLYHSIGFVTINNPNLTSYDGSYILDGNIINSSIKNLTLNRYDNGKYVSNNGLFGTFNGGEIKNLSLVNISVPGGSNSGALIGINVNETTISDVYVYLNNDNYELGNIDENHVFIAGSNNVGGLVGSSSSSLIIKDSFVASVIGNKSSGNVGGLVGRSSSNLIINNSYGDNYIYGLFTSGLVGYGQGNITISDSYSAGFLYGSTGQYGLARARANITNSYSANVLLGTGNEKYTTSLNGSDISNVYYLDVDIDATSLVGSTGYKYKDLSNRALMVSKLGSSFSSVTGGNLTVAYNLKEGLGLSNYSFPRLINLVHYGDWQATFESGSLVYYEKYLDGTYGYYGSNKGTLKEKVVVGDGYGLIFEGNPDYVTIPVEVNDTIYNIDTTNMINIENSINLVILDKQISDTSYEDSYFYQQIILYKDLDNEASYFYNPHFARSQSLDNQKPSVPNTVYIRSARQLYDMSKYYEKYGYNLNNCTFIMDTDIDYDEYEFNNYALVDNVNSQGPIGSSDVPFKGTFNGTNHIIKGVSFVDSGSYIGLFGVNNGTLRNIVLNNRGTLSRSVGIEGYQTEVNFGALAAYNSGNIINCAVASYSSDVLAYTGAKVYYGGLVGVNEGSITNSSADLRKVNLSSSYATTRIAGLVGVNKGDINRSYAIGSIYVSESKRGDNRIAGFVGQNEGIIRESYAATSLEAAGSVESYAFSSFGGSVTSCLYLYGGTYQYNGVLYSYNNITGAGSKTSYENLTIEGIISGFDKADNSIFNNTNGNFEFITSVTDRNNQFVHYGDWPIKPNLGATGVFYWEKEEEGTNNGYHLTILGVNADNQMIEDSTLCRQHDDGGIITDFGYGYFTLKGQEDITSISLSGFGDNNLTINAEASSALDNQINEYRFYAYDSLKSDKNESKTNKLYINDSSLYGKFTINYNNQYYYEYSITPFFGESMSYDGYKTSIDGALNLTNNSKPGEENNNFVIRSIDQLQFINWNYSKDGGTAHGIVQNTTANDATNNSYTYLGYLDSNNKRLNNVYFKQAHDIKLQTGKYFTPIGSLYDAASKLSNECQGYIAFFGGTYDGQNYQIKNIEISSTNQCIGLFGFTSYAKLKNIVMYSDMSNTIALVGGDNWYMMGGLVGFAADDSSSTSSISNCTVSGYNIVVAKTRENIAGWGGGCVGGLVGATNMAIEKCASVNDILIDIDASKYHRGYENIRVGGLVGCSRNAINYSYAGGSITSGVTNGLTNGDSTNETSIWAGGIMGGVILKNSGTIAQVLGNVTSKASVNNCYSYVIMPVKSNASLVRDSMAIASNGEMTDNAYAYIGGSTIIITNSYALESAVTNTVDYKKVSISTGNERANYLNGTTRINEAIEDRRSVTLSNNGNYPYLSYEQMSNGTLLNYLGSSFTNVTVLENGIAADGKYSFPGDNIALQGLNYPFPTVLIGKSLIDPDVTVNIHYGKWPTGELYFDSSMNEIDLLSNYSNSDNYAYIDLKLYSLTNNGTKPTIEIVDENKNPVSDVLECTIGNYTNGYFPVRVKALKVGSAYLVAKYQDYVDSIATVNVTKELKADASILNIRMLENQTSEVITLSATSKDLTKDFSTDTNTIWLVSSSDETVAIADIKNKNEITINSQRQGEAMINITATYTRGSEVFEGSVNIVVKVVKPLEIGLSNSSIYNTVREDIDTADTNFVGKDLTDFENIPSIEGYELFLFQKGGDFDIDSFKIDEVILTVDNVKHDLLNDNNDYGLYFRNMISDEEYNYLPITLYGKESKNISLTIKIHQGVKHYEFNLSHEFISKPIRVNYITSYGDLIYTKDVVYNELPTLSEAEIENIDFNNFIYPGYHLPADLCSEDAWSEEYTKEVKEVTEITANFMPNIYHIEYICSLANVKVNEGFDYTLEDGTYKVISADISYGDPYLLLNPYSCDGYILVGWENDNHDFFDAGSYVLDLTDKEENVKLYAIFEKTIFTVTYLNGGDVVETINIDTNENPNIEIIDSSKLTKPSENAKFKGWKYSENGSVYNPKDNFIVTGDTTFEAIWQ